jgi:hypothetical protein
VGKEVWKGSEGKEGKGGRGQVKKKRCGNLRHPRKINHHQHCVSMVETAKWKHHHCATNHLYPLSTSLYTSR